MRTFEIVLSTKERILIDEEDLEKLKSNIGSGNLIALKNAIVNPSFIVTIVPKGKLGSEEVGHLDEERGLFVVTGERPMRLEDQFERPVKSTKELLR